MFRPAQSPPHLVTLVFMSALSVVALNLFAPSLASMAEDLNTTYAVVNLSIAGFLAITAILQLLLGPLSDIFGRRTVFLTCVAAFILASVGCALAENIGVFLIFRILQGGIIAGSTLSRAVVRDVVGGDQAVSMLGYVSMAMALAPILGPILGGVLEQFYGWRYSFGFFALAGIALFWLCWVDMGETNRRSTGGFAAHFRAYPALFSTPHFWGYGICIAFSIGSFFVFISAAPMVASAVLNTSPAALGFFIGSISIGFFIGSFFSGRFAGKIGSARLIVGGRIVTCLGLSAGLLAVSLGWVSSLTVFGATIFIGIGNGLSLPAANVGVLSVREDLIGSAAGASGAFVVAVGAALTLITGAVLRPETAAVTLLSLTLCCAVVSLVAGVLAIWFERRV